MDSLGTGGPLPQPAPLPLAPAPPRVACAAGDLVHPTQLDIAHAVAQLARQHNCDVLPLLGDYVYDRGDLARLRELFTPVWGDLMWKIYPVLGNHESPPDYYTYFGGQAGPAGLGYYSFEVGNWLFIALNSEISQDAAQQAWLKAELARKRSKCEVLYWHTPYFSAGPHAPNASARGLFAAAEQAGVELVLTSHNHNYQRFAPQTADGRASALGVRQLVVGTGGAPLRRVTDLMAPNLERQDASSYGLLKLTLFEGSYIGDFVPIPGRSFSDSFDGTCH